MTERTVTTRLTMRIGEFIATCRRGESKGGGSTTAVTVEVPDGAVPRLTVEGHGGPGEMEEGP